jgi:hypothetical protein
VFEVRVFEGEESEGSWGSFDLSRGRGREALAVYATRCADGSCHFVCRVESLRVKQTLGRERRSTEEERGD